MDLRDVFEEMDKTGDANGKLDQSEFTAGLQKVEPDVSDHEAANQFKMADTDNTGQILFSTFCKLVASRRKSTLHQSTPGTGSLPDVSARAAAAVKQCPEPSPVVGSGPPADVPVFEPLPRAYPSPYPDPGALAHSAAALSTITPRENCDGRSVSPETKLQPVNYLQRALPQPEREQQQQHLQVCKISDEEQDLYRPYFPRTSHRCVFHRDLHHLAIAQTPD